jgi:hypothetical protein
VHNSVDNYEKPVKSHYDCHSNFIRDPRVRLLRCWGLSRRQPQRVSLLSLHARWRIDHERSIAGCFRLFDPVLRTPAGVMSQRFQYLLFARPDIRQCKRQVSIGPRVCENAPIAEAANVTRSPRQLALGQTMGS